MALEIAAPSPFLKLRNQSPRELTARTMVEEYYKSHHEDGTKQTIKAVQTRSCVVYSFTYLCIQPLTHSANIYCVLTMS